MKDKIHNIANHPLDHTRTKAKSPQTNGICERFHKTILNEFYQIAFRKKLYQNLEELQADADKWIWQWLTSTPNAHLKRTISRWNRKPVQSSILVEFPSPHAAERSTMWFVRTKTKAYYFEEVERNPHNETTEPLDRTAYDRLFDAMSLWQQAPPVKAEDAPKQAMPGYQGFLSFYNRDGSRQMLLTAEDFVICSDKKCENFKPGRFWETVVNIIPGLRKLGTTHGTNCFDASGSSAFCIAIGPAMPE